MAALLQPPELRPCRDLMNRRLFDSKVPSRALYLLFGVTVFTLLLMVAYVSVRVTMVFSPGHSIADETMAVLLFGAELFLIVHGVGYFFSVIKAARRQLVAMPIVFAGHTATPVAVLVAAFNESEDVLEETLAAVRAMDYPAVTIYLLDDSTRPECRLGAERLALKYRARLLHRRTRAGYKAGAINDLIPQIAEPYLAVLDADQRPVGSWLKDVIPYMVENPTLAFVQAPQVYVNTEGLPVAEAASYQQAVFFEYICEGKSYSNAMFCCGSNVVIRRAALLSIECVVDGRHHYFDETSVTEDFATSIRLHARGWRTAYVNQTYVVGMGPETLPAYFTQQMRWAMGTLAVGLHAMRDLARDPMALAAGQWWEYLLSGTYYFVGFANAIFMAAPIGFIFFNIRPFQTHSDLYLAFFIPYIVFTMNLFFFGMKLRRYSIRGVWLASALSFSTFRIYMTAALVAVFGLKRAFGVTPKGVGGGAVPLTRLLPELAMFLVNAAAAVAGLYFLVISGGDLSYVVNTVWATYHAILLSTLFFYFNRPVTIHARRPLFEPLTRAA
jgi:cellulose synthase (UDP-forming)